MSNSPKFKINAVDLWKSFRGFLVTILAAFVTYVAGIYTNIDYTFSIKGTEIDFAMIAIPVIGAMIEIGRRYITNHQG